jgi:hypothetical protein
VGDFTYEYMMFARVGRKEKRRVRAWVPRNYRKEKDPEKGPAFASIDATQRNSQYWSSSRAQGTTNNLQEYKQNSQ